MSKDPAFLFYYQDWLVGTYFLSRREKGAYMDLLCYQADKGVLTLASIKEALNGDFDCWDKLKEKFIEEDGIFYNKRLMNERQKRQKYSESRRNNRCKTYDEHMENENEDVIESEIELMWKRWKNYKKAEFNFSYKSEISEQAAKQELLNLSGNNEEIAIKIIEQSISQGWKGFFKLKANGTNKGLGATPEQLANLVASTEAVDRD